MMRWVSALPYRKEEVEEEEAVLDAFHAGLHGESCRWGGGESTAASHLWEPHLPEAGAWPPPRHPPLGK